MTRTLVAGLALASVLCMAREAGADQADCPPGSVEKNEDTFTWCEPTICLNDGQCNPGHVCVQMPLCMEVGNLSKPGSTVDGGSRLIARQICAEGTCPQKQTCSDMKRCLPRATAERMGKLGGPAPSSSAPSTATPPAKSACGCDAVGASSSRGAFVLAAVALGALVVRRRRR